MMAECEDPIPLHIARRVRMFQATAKKSVILAGLFIYTITCSIELGFTSTRHAVEKQET